MQGLKAQSVSIKDLLLKVKEASYYDSLRLFSIGEKVIATATESNQLDAVAEVHIYYGNYFFYIRNLKQAGSYFNLALKEAEEVNAPKLKTLARIRIAFLAYDQGNRSDSEKELQALLQQADATNDFENVCELYNLLGIIKEDNNQTKEAVQLYLKGFSVSEANQLNYYAAVFRNNVGIIKLNTGQTKQAIADFEEGLKIAKKENNKRLISHLQLNICLAFVSEKKTDQASDLFKEVIDYARTNNLPNELASSYINLGSAFTNAGKTDVALRYYDSALVVLKKHDLKPELTRAFLGKANILIDAKRLMEADELLVEIKKLASQTGNIADLSSYHYMKYRIHSSKGDAKTALTEYIAYQQIRDSLDNQMNSKVIEELQQNYTLQKKEVELEKEKSKTLMLEKSNQEERYQKWLSIATAIVLLVFVIIIVFLIYNKRIKAEQVQFSRQLIQNIEEERNRISRDLHDDIGQSLSIIKSKIKQEKPHPKETTDHLEAELGRVIEQTREISRNLYPTHLEKIGLNRSIAALLESVQNATQLECSSEISEKVDSLPLGVQTHVFRIIQECINNTIKHSGATGLKLIISDKGGDFNLLYQDNGMGFKMKKNYFGMGLQSIKERAKIINGVIDAGGENGFKLFVKFKPKMPN